MKRVYTDKEFKRMADEYSKVKYKCKCGHIVVIPKWLDKQLCRWCGQFVFKDKKDEFEYRIKESMLRKGEK